LAPYAASPFSARTAVRYHRDGCVTLRSMSPRMTSRKVCVCNKRRHLEAAQNARFVLRESLCAQQHNSGYSVNGSFAEYAIGAARLPRRERSTHIFTTHDSRT
jgi:hypothetical protein